MAWEPGPDSFPDGDIDKITDFAYLDELHFVRHAKAPPETSESLWQLARDFRVSCTVHPAEGDPYPVTLTAPQGMYTDLASVPKAVWNIVGPIGKHLEASIIHDYLFMAWTDYRDKAMDRDWDFANKVFQAGMKVSGVSGFRRTLIHIALRLVGWSVFRKKPYTFEARMNGWLPNLDAGHQREDLAA